MPKANPYPVGQDRLNKEEGATISQATNGAYANVSNLFFGIVAGAIGMAYFVYGRRQTKLVPVIAGVLLCVYPYFVQSWLWLGVVGALLLVAPFIIDF